MAKTKITGFTRLLLFLIIFLPIAFFGASYYNGEDPVAKIKGWFGVENTENSVSDYDRENYGNGNASGGSQRPATFENVQDLRRELDLTKRELAITKEELARCKTDGVQ